MHVNQDLSVAETAPGYRLEISKVLLSLAAVNALFVVLRLAYFSGYQGMDDAIYISYARSFAANNAVDPNIKTHWIGRAGGWLPMALGFKLGLQPPLASTWMQLCCSLATLNVAFALAVRRLGLRTAQLSGILLASCPNDVIYSTASYIDCSAASMVWICAVIVLWTTDARENVWRQRCAGFAFGLGFLNTEISVLALPPLFLTLLPIRWKTLFRFAANFGLGGALALALEFGFWTHQTGDPLYRYRATDVRAMSNPNQLTFDPQTHPQPTPRRWSLPAPLPGGRYYSNDLAAVLKTLFLNEEYALFTWLGIPAVLLGLMSRERLVRDLSVFTVCLLTLLLYAPVLEGKYSLHRDPRYYLAASAPLALCSGFMLSKRLNAWGQFAVAGAVATSSVVALQLTDATRSMPSLRELHEFRCAHSDQRLWVSPWTAGFLAYHSNYDQDSDLGLILIEQTQGSNSLRKFRTFRPDVPTVEHLAEVPAGYAVVSELNTEPIPSWWQEVTVIAPREPLVGAAIPPLKRIGMPPRILKNLNPAIHSMRVYHVGQR